MEGQNISKAKSSSSQPARIQHIPLNFKTLARVILSLSNLFASLLGNPIAVHTDSYLLNEDALKLLSTLE